MKKRPLTTKQLILELTGYDQGLVSAACYGSLETPLDGFYHILDLDDAIKFPASSWKSREKDGIVFSLFVQSANIYEIFEKVYQIGTPWLDKHNRFNKPDQDISERLRQLYQKLNPFQGVSLRERLESVDSAVIEALKEQLQGPVNRYIFEIRHNRPGLPRDKNPYTKTVVMNFQETYPKRGKVVPAFAAKVSRIIREYTQEYEPLAGAKPQPTNQQLALL